ncbi:Aldehyde dehydrogenase 8 member A1 [Spiromyces aspiralis]|uniref:Aldehyde dehydrogenase 8 member A1 n=1 Tax=Spiromyces aspiralis TaxID=68401 RepID=A0ACC1HW63_9FUNG|nr:Aldehyde dehydrogenase 8 member A1 [Spiromyces aspiralis]
MDAAIAAANRAFPDWSAMFVSERARCLENLARLMEAHQDLLVHYETLETGTIRLFNNHENISLAIDSLRDIASYISKQLVRPSARLVSADLGFKGRDEETRDLVNLTYREPIGIACIYSPCTVPTYHMMWKVAACLASGNTCVCKPHPLTSISAYIISVLTKQAGIPDGVFNIVYGDDIAVSGGLASDPRVAAISMMGSTRTFPETIPAANSAFKRTEVEFAGNNPTIVFGDCDLDRCVETCLRSCFVNKGEICTCTRRVFVHRSVYREFVARFKQAVRQKIRIGDPFDDSVYYGPYSSSEMDEKVRGFIVKAQEEGVNVDFLLNDEQVADGSVRLNAVKDGRVIVKGRCEGARFVAPTVITEISPESQVVTEFYFGPVVCVMPFDTEEEVVGYANNVRYILGAVIWSEDQQKAKRIANQLRTGYIWSNCWYLRDMDMAFGGLISHGAGRSGLEDIIEFYTQAKTLINL